MGSYRAALLGRGAQIRGTMGNIVSYFRAKPEQADAVQQTKLAREITEDTMEKNDEQVIIHQQDVEEELTPSTNEAEDKRLEEIEDAEESFDDFDVIQDKNAKNLAIEIKQRSNYCKTRNV
eukprot:TRINITY_DN16399_c0_g1_i1.p1 TRINITY_DN16399_c0_g1~~TRINITY_DN16399_c0_g1_i1.p1  ORF type:complete len:129 (-),score=44.52 TRINITY_DN16399_c0_g1_i1:151-513(-)